MSQVLDEVFKDESAMLECVQIAPTGPNSAAILFEIGTFEREFTHSFIVEVDDFEPAGSRMLFEIDDWLLSLSGSGTAALEALEVGRTVWSSSGGTWSSLDVAPRQMNRLWMPAPDRSYLVGTDCTILRRDGTSWHELDTGGRLVDLNDVHGTDRANVMAVGGLGSILQCRDSDIVDRSIPDQVDLWCVHSGAGGIRVGGEGGYAALIRDDELIPLETPGDQIMAVGAFNGTQYWGDVASGVLVEADLGLEPFFACEAAYDIRTTDKFMYVAGAGVAWRFDGTTWKGLTAEYRDGWALVSVAS